MLKDILNKQLELTRQMRDMEEMGCLNKDLMEQALLTMLVNITRVLKMTVNYTDQEIADIILVRKI